MAKKEPCRSKTLAKSGLAIYLVNQSTTDTSMIANPEPDELRCYMNPIRDFTAKPIGRAVPEE